MKNINEKLKEAGIHEMSDFEDTRDEVEREFKIDGINRGIQNIKGIASSYTNKDRGIKASAVIDQWYDHQTNQEDINKAIIKVEERANRETHKESRAKKIIRTFMSEGYFGYLRLRKLIDRPLEHPVLRPWYAGELIRIPSLVNPGGKVTITEGEYSLSNSINPKANLVLEGNGWQNTSLKMAAAVSAFEFGAYDKITLRGFAIDGNSRAYSTHEIIDGTGNEDITLENLYIHDHNTSYGLEFLTGKRIRILDSWFTKIGGGTHPDSDPISLQGCEDVRVDGNWIYDVSFTTHRGGGIEVQDTSDKIIIVNNHIEKAQNGMALTTHVDTQQNAQYIIANNYISIYNVTEIGSQYQNGIAIMDYSNTLLMKNVVVANNIIRVNCLTGDHDNVQYYWNTGIAIASAEDVLIANNVIDNAAFTQEKGNEGIVLNYMKIKDVLITGNIIRNCYKRGIVTNLSTIENIHILGNLCHDCDYGIKIEDGDYIFMEDNNVRNNTTSAITVDSGKNQNGWIRNNPGYNPVGISSISVGASEFTHTAGASPETIYISGGTVSLIKKGTTTIFTDTGHSVELEPHELCKVTYSSIPTMYKDVH